MAQAMTLISSQVLGSTATSITFSSIPGTYRDLRLVLNPIWSGTGVDMGVYFNGVTGTSAVYMAGFGTSTGSGTVTDLLGYTTSAGMLNEINIFDYAQTDKHKSGVTRYGAAGNFAAANAFRWASTAAITSIQFYVGSGNFAVGSSFYLYGIQG